LQRIGTAAGILFKVAGEQGEIKRVLVLGSESKAPSHEFSRPIISEQQSLGLGGGPVGAGRFGIAATVKMLGLKHWIVGKYPRRSLVQLTLSSVC
jgi:hypothetical protein